jgi:FAD/FMN-containing dehydrogenase
MTFLAELQALLGTGQVLTGADTASYTTDWRGRYQGDALAVARPASTQEVSGVIQLCACYGVAVVPQGGNTGLCGGATPLTGMPSLVVSLVRLNQVRAIDTANDTMTVEAGCILQTVQQAALAAGRLFPLSLASEGSCTIGGNLATNAGGTQVLRYGTARELTLGIEVVTPEGQIWQGLRGLRKNNTGYDLRDLYIGSEGTLGIITAATLKLYPRPVARGTALLALGSIEDSVRLLVCARHGFGAALTGFELIARNCLEAVVQCFPDQRLPFRDESAQSPWFVLVELSDSESAEHAQARFETVLGQALQAGWATAAVIAESDAQAQALWQLRERIPLAEAKLGKAIKHDISLPISCIAEFVRMTNALLQQQFSGVGHIIFGHLGDGNLHYNVTPALGQSEADLLALQARVHTLVHDSVHAHGGSISAEHGIGQLKVDELPRYKDALELVLMRRIKQVLDPAGIMNPGKVVRV